MCILRWTCVTTGGCYLQYGQYRCTALHLQRNFLSKSNQMIPFRTHNTPKHMLQHITYLYPTTGNALAAHTLQQLLSTSCCLPTFSASCCADYLLGTPARAAARRQPPAGQSHATPSRGSPAQPQTSATRASSSYPTEELVLTSPPDTWAIQKCPAPQTLFQTHSPTT